MVPKYNGSRPYQQLVFQYSLHIQETLTSVIEHREYLADPSQDPRIGFIEQLIEDCVTSGDILVYNIGFEIGKLNDLIDVFAGCIFTEKFENFDFESCNNIFTPEIKSIMLASKVLKSNKNKKEVKNDLLSNMAPPLGLEPRTL